MTSRRRFVQLVGAAGMALAGCQSRTRAPTALAATEATPAIPARRVVSVRNMQAVQGSAIDAAAVEVLLDRAMARLSPDGDAIAAWKALFRPSDVVAIKVNCLSGPPVCSHPALVAAVAKRLRDAAQVDPSRIIVYDRDTGELAAAGFEPVDGLYEVVGSDRAGYDAEPTVSGAAGSCYSRVVSEAATAIINVPVLKDHDLAGLTGALKNHFGSIHNPNKMHTDHCCPYVADVNCAPQLRDKQRLIVYDALLVCYDGGPGYKPDTTLPYGTVMAATDPVAADAVAFSLLESLRQAHGLPPIAGTDRAPRYIEVAADSDHGLGVADLRSIEIC